VIVKATSIVSKAKSTKDALLLGIELPDTVNVQVLLPYKGKIFKGDELTLIGCEYADGNCHQRKYTLEMDIYEEGLILVKPEIDINFSGFSGAPVVNELGYVVGILCGGFDFEGEAYLYLEPINSLKEYLWE